MKSRRVTGDYMDSKDQWTSIPHIEQLKAMLTRHEGVRLTPYRCTAGKLTIGVGRNIEDNGISEEESSFMLDNDILRVHDELRMYFVWYPYISEARKAALIDMCFNLGISRFTKFKKMLAAIERLDFDDAASEMLDSKWAIQVGSRSAELSEMMRKG